MVFEKMGTSGVVHTLPKQIVLQHTKDNTKIAIKALRYDAEFGWFAENLEGKKRWYNERYWKYIKEVGV